MKNKIKKFGALFMALMLLVSGFGNLGTALAEDTPQEIDWAIDPETARDDQYVKFEDEGLKNYILDKIERDGNTNKDKKHKDQITFEEAKTIKDLDVYDRYSYDFSRNFNSWKGLEFLVNLENLDIQSYRKRVPMHFSELKDLKELHSFQLLRLGDLEDMFLLNIPEHLMTIQQFRVGGETDGPQWITGYKDGHLVFKDYYEKDKSDYLTFDKAYEITKKKDFLAKMNFNQCDTMGNIVWLSGSGINNIEPFKNLTFPMSLYINKNFIADITPLELNNKNMSVVADNQMLLYKPTQKDFVIPVKTKDNSKVVYEVLDISEVPEHNMIFEDIDDTYIPQKYPESKEPVIENGTLKLRYKTKSPVVVHFKYESNDVNLELNDDVLKHAAENYVKAGADNGDGLEKTFEYFKESFANKKRSITFNGNIFIDPSNIQWDADLFTPETKSIVKLVGQEITENEYKGAITNLPANLDKFEVITPADTNTVGDKTAIVRLTFEDNSTKDVEITVKVRTKAGMVDDEISKGKITSEKEIVPWGGEYDLTDNIIGVTDDMGLTDKIDVTEPKIDTKETGNHTGKVKLVFDDGSELIVDVPVEVLAKPEDPKTNADEHTPEGKDLNVNVGDEPKAEDAITNKADLPEGTKYEWKEKPDTKEPGKKPAIVVVTYPDGSKDEVPVNINVIDPKTDAEKNPVNKPKKTEVEDKSKLTPEEKTKVEEEVKKVNPEAKDIEVKDNGDTTITYPDGSTNTLPSEDTVIENTKEDIPLTPLTPAEPVEPKKEYSKEPKVDPIYEDDTKITGKGEPRADIEIRLPNHKTVYGTTDRDGYFEIETKIKLYEDEKVYVTQIEYGKEPSKEVVETVRRSYGHRNDKKDAKKDATSTSDVIGVLNSVQEKLITSDHSSYIVGYPNGNFGPNNTITRAEAATIFARLSKDQRVTNNVTFKDVKNTDWFNKAVKIGVSQGFINGYSDGTFKPNKPITRAEFASVIATYANKAASSNAFNDVNGWSVEAIDTAYANGWMQGNRGTFRPNDPLTRAEAVTVINRMLNRQADRIFIANAINSHAARVYKDINPNNWYFYDVYAASWGHSYTIENGIEKWTGLNGKAFTIR